MFFTNDGGSYSLTTAGLILSIAAIVVLLLLTGLIHVTKVAERERIERNERAGSIFTVRQLVFSAIAIAIAFALSYVKLVHMPWGGSITLCSMLFVTMVGYWYGPKIGIITAFAYGLLQFVQEGGSYMLDPLQVCLDYLVAFAALGLAGLFYKFKNHGLMIGYIVGALARGFFHTVGGYLYWMDYMPENFPAQYASIYPIAYNYSYILGEMIITLIIINIPAVKKAIERTRLLATM